MQLFHMQWISYRIRFLKSRIGILLPPLVNIIPANGRLAFVRNKQTLRSGGVHGQLQTLRVRGSFLYAHCWSRRTLSTYAQTYSMASRTLHVWTDVCTRTPSDEESYITRNIEHSRTQKLYFAFARAFALKRIDVEYLAKKHAITELKWI